MILDNIILVVLTFIGAVTVIRHASDAFLEWLERKEREHRIRRHYEF